MYQNFTRLFYHSSINFKQFAHPVLKEGRHSTTAISSLRVVVGFLSTGKFRQIKF